MIIVALKIRNPRNKRRNFSPFSLWAAATPRENCCQTAHRHRKPAARRRQRAHKQRPYVVGTCTGRILKGVTPSDLPVVQAVKPDLMINLETAKALDLDIPLPLLGRADETIE